MCRSKADGGRRCHLNDPEMMALQSAKQAATRMGERLERAESRRISDSHMQTRVARLVAAHERVHEREQAVTGTAVSPSSSSHSTQPETQPVGPAQPSVARSITAERVDQMTWDEISHLSSELRDDPEAWEKLQTLVEDKEARENSQDLQAWISGSPSLDEDPATNPAARPARNLTAHERAREEYESYTASQYFQAEAEVGFMLNAEGRKNGIDAFSLFSGPVSRVKRYGSEELQAWFGRNGRQTLASFRYDMLGWYSDHAAAQRSRTESFDDVARV